MTNDNLGTMELEWDENKRETNIRKHGINFADLEPFFLGDLDETVDTRHEDETRWIAQGFLYGRLLVVVYEERGDKIHVISARGWDKTDAKRP